MPTADDRKTWGARIVEGRKAKDWSQPRLAHEVGLHPTTVSEIERGLIGSDDTRARIAAALDLPDRDLTEPIEEGVA
jgi:transcriptional regulator with XRE-family HTH domain